MAYTSIEIEALIDTNILSGGRRTIASNVRTLLKNANSSYINIKDGGTVVEVLTGYSSDLTPSDDKHFTPKKYVVDLIAAEAYDDTPVFYKDGSRSMTADLNTGGNNIISGNLDFGLDAGTGSINFSGSGGLFFNDISKFTNSILADGGIDVTATAGSDVLNIGTTNANVINYGNSSTTHNFLGVAIYEYQANAYVTDKLITLNSGGSLASGIGVGFEIEENSIITGYFKTNGGRTGYELKAPGTAGVSTFIMDSSSWSYTMPGATGTLALTSDLNDYLSLSGGTVSGTVTALNFICNTTVDTGTPDAGFKVDRLLSANAASGHGFRDQTDFRQATYAYCSYDSASFINAAGADDFDHIISFQHRAGMSSLGTLSEMICTGDYGSVNSGIVSLMYGLVSSPTFAAGTNVVTRFGVRIREASGTGTNNNTYGIYIDELNKASGDRYAIYVAGNNPSFFSAITGTTLVLSSTLTASSDSDATTILGRARIHSATSDFAMFSHFDHSSASSYAVRQGVAGHTTINSASGQTLRLAIANTSMMSVSASGLTFEDAKNLIFDTTTGSKIGTSTSQKIGIWNATPIVQPTTGVTEATLVSNGGTTLTSTDTFDGYTLLQIVKLIRNIGLAA